jgi:hypothetical protein
LEAYRGGGRLGRTRGQLFEGGGKLAFEICIAEEHLREGRGLGSRRERRKEGRRGEKGRSRATEGESERG